ncbi:MAG: hypothetical protein AAB871_03985 [Patescibacteria group bacterium]
MPYENREIIEFGVGDRVKLTEDAKKHLRPDPNLPSDYWDDLEISDLNPENFPPGFVMVKKRGAATGKSVKSGNLERI